MILNLNTPIFDFNGNVLSKVSNNTEVSIRYSELILTNLLNNRSTDINNTEIYFNLAKKIQEDPENVNITKEEANICFEMLSNQALLVKGRFLEMVNEKQGISRD